MKKDWKPYWDLKTRKVIVVRRTKNDKIRYRECECSSCGEYKMKESYFNKNLVIITDFEVELLAKYCVK
jgi:hypothetical protein